ncbi:hypothetical protein BJ508DRAFT_323217 [Ascobolus immersus RN42]|uniref:Uncharacterized protein n=1 Tax=Ascobolus immersus RN42 TaxID=1160509 RepID=A0A3N4ILG3_ASCIM|nr:hypothetical protein BJ508DRAFT_323217 [Ascobolus immersus RN42]
MRQFPAPGALSENLRPEERYAIRAAALGKVIQRYIGNPPDAGRAGEYPLWDDEVFTKCDTLLAVMTAGSRPRLITAAQAQFDGQRRFDVATTATDDEKEITEEWLEHVLNAILEEPSPGSQAQIEAEAERAARLAQGNGTPAPHPPGLQQLLQQLADNQIALTNLQRGSRAPDGGAGGGGNRDYFPKAREIGEFNPKKRPDHMAAYNWLLRVDNAVTTFTEASVMKTVLTCIEGDTANAWLDALPKEDLTKLTANTAGLKEIIQRDWFLPVAALRMEADALSFRWDDGRLPTEFMTDKVKLYKMSGITDENLLVNMVHQGFRTEPDIQAALAGSNAYDYSSITNTIAVYRNKLQALQEPLKVKFDKRKKRTAPSTFRSGNSSSSSSRNPHAPFTDAKKTHWTHTNGRKYTACRQCGGAHFNDLCPKTKSSTTKSTSETTLTVTKPTIKMPFVKKDKERKDKGKIVKGYMIVDYDSDDDGYGEVDSYRAFYVGDPHED